ncbi:MAG TPA: exo-alpha-sialidase [Phaeodactylibacter sp.]|nr:exo-alpha-sialidase [Phaeodactylibacter sp.]
MKKSILLLAPLFFFLFCSCQEKKEAVFNTTIKEIPSPCKEGGVPNLFISENGTTYLSWVEYLNDTTDALVFSKLKNEKWSSPHTIATGSDWFVNWADFPSLVAYEDGGKSLAAHWLQTSAKGSYDYDVRVAQSMDGGRTWSKSFIPHRDGIPAEHGFVSMLPLSDNNIFATWLDGRNTKGEENEADAHGHGQGGAMTLRGAIFDKKGTLTQEVELDNRTCDCCQTSVALTDKGLIVAYRDRSEKEIRDIYIVRQVGEEWTSPQPIFNDDWKISGCPVNGPVIVAEDKNVAIAWFSAPEKKARVKIAFSKDSGANFSLPIRVDDGKPLGRVDIVMLSPNEALVSWLEEADEGAVIKAVRVNPKGKIGESFNIANSNAARQSGFPRMEKNKNQIIFAWTNADSISRVKTAVLDL